MNIRNQKGNVTVAGILIITSMIILIGVTLTAYNQIKIELQHCHLNNIRAKILSYQGLENAVSELQALSSGDLINIKTEASPSKEGGWYYYGEDLNRNGLLNRGEDQNNNKVLDIETCLLKYALRPSFVLTDQGGEPLLIRLSNGSFVGYSGELAKTYSNGKDIYSLKIIDCNSQIYINGDDVSAKGGSRQLLNNLGVILSISEFPALGDYIFEMRNKKPSKRFKVKEELEPIMTKPIYERIKDYVTLYGQVDAKVIKPNPYPNLRGQIKDGVDIFSWKELIKSDLTIEPRHPIDINTASKVVLMAVLANLEGVYLQQSISDEEKEKLQQDDPFLFSGGVDKPARKRDNTLTPEMRLGRLQIVDLNIPENIHLIDELAERIIEERNRSPFLEWQAFNRFFDNLVQEGFFGDAQGLPEDYEMAQAKADLIKANANPNTLLNKFNPDRIVYHSMDKTDLITYTTEFCFTPRGYFEIESEGMVLRLQDNAMIIESNYLTRGIVHVYEVYNETNQADFSSGKISNQKTLGVIRQSKALHTYPQPDIEHLPVNCYEDGQIALATNENSYNDKRQHITFRHHFNNGLTANHSKGDSQPVIITGNDVTSGSIFNGGVLYPDGIYSDINSCPVYSAENNFVDGIDYEQLYNKKRFTGAVSFWFKPNYYETSVKPRVIFSLNKNTNKPPHPKYNYQVCQNIFSIMAFPKSDTYKNTFSSSLKTTPAGKYIWFWDIDESLGNQPDEYIFANGSEGEKTDKTPWESDRHHQWVHIGIAWDTQPGLTKESKICSACLGKKESDGFLNGYCRYCLGTGEIPEMKMYPSDVYTFCINGSDSKAEYIYKQPELFPPEIIQHIDFSSGNSMRFGERPDASFWDSSGDFTIDEIIIRLPDNVREAKEFFKTEFANGRYYKGESIFTSGPITINFNNIPDPGNQRLKSDKIKIIPTWTVYWPDNSDKTKGNVGIQLLNNEEMPLSSLCDKQASLIEISKGEENNFIFKYRILFSSKEEDFNTPLLESPFLDDVNFIVFRVTPEIIEQFVIED
ncbi:MAG: hypothetical protein V1709_06350 [Planctomycetota bacterium]